MGILFGWLADRTAARRLCRPYVLLFCLVPLPSVVVFVILNREPSLLEDASAWLSGGAGAALRALDAILLPRSLGDLATVDDALGSPYREAALLSDTGLALGGVCAVAWTLARVDAAAVDDAFAPGRLALRLLVVLAFLGYRPADLTQGSLTGNELDDTGLFLLKEAVIVAAGYQVLAQMLVDAQGRLARRCRGRRANAAVATAASNVEAER